MISGIGVDLVDMVRFEHSLRRTPALRERLFCPGERGLAPRSLAGRFAAKEALIKALGGSDGLRWQEVEVVTDAEGAPSFSLSGGTAERVRGLGIGTVHLSITHDAGRAMAFVVAERMES
ncbi:holo-ACP synthase [Mycetocola spongiae]|uniref:holo-ACP synthase n=1 Tax=Mycetocola spongiae TaxID=2859226 RepID=UPI001CF2D502|nr:holo-ACP synthase [Mycetocola spongiae]UCR88609.1 holo-ACP synthase [Mycetocola spongiae]